LKLLIDHNLSPALAQSLQPLFPEHRISSLRDKFDVEATDLEWIKALDREGGWAALTKDLRIRTRPHERQALDSSKIVFFFLSGSWKNFTVAETAARLIRLVPLMSQQTELAERGRLFIAINSG
jgi:hypothetical protein